MLYFKIAYNVLCALGTNLFFFLASLFQSFSSSFSITPCHLHFVPPPPSICLILSYTHSTTTITPPSSFTSTTTTATHPSFTFNLHHYYEISMSRK